MINLESTIPNYEVSQLDVTDEQLMAGVQKGDADALENLFDRHAPIIKSVALKVVNNDSEADDLLQEIFMEIWSRAASYAPEKGKPLGWMVTLARRRSIDRLRKRQAYSRAEDRLKLEVEQQPEAYTMDQEEDIYLADVREMLGRVLRSLPTAQREAVELAYYKGMSQREIAAHTGIPLGTIKTRLELGLKKITAALAGFAGEF